MLSVPPDTSIPTNPIKENEDDPLALPSAPDVDTLVQVLICKTATVYLACLEIKMMVSTIILSMLCNLPIPVVKYSSLVFTNSHHNAITIH